MAALAAGARRKAQAKSAASSSTGSEPGGSSASGKRARADVASTPSTQVTPEKKLPCTEARAEAVNPKSLDFDAAVDGSSACYVFN